MRLVMIYTTGDGCSYSNEWTLPIEYESAEAAIVDFDTAAHEANFTYLKTFTFAGHRFDATDFFWEDYNLKGFASPQFLTLDEWFAEPRGV